MKIIDRIEIKYFRSFGEKSVKIIELNSKNKIEDLSISTMITETRESIDSSENS